MTEKFAKLVLDGLQEIAWIVGGIQVDVSELKQRAAMMEWRAGQLRAMTRSMGRREPTERSPL